MSITHTSSVEAPQSPAGVDGWSIRLLLLVLIACIVAPIWITEYFPSQNGPWFLLPTQMFIKYNDPAFDYSTWFVRNWHPIPHMLHDVFVGLLSLALPLLIAEKVALTVNVLVVPLSIYLFVKAVAPQGKWVAALAFTMSLSYPFFRGYHDFTLSIALFFFALAYWYPRREHLRLKDYAILNVLVVLTFCSHLFTFALLTGVLGWIRMFELRSFPKAFVPTWFITWPGWLMTADYLWLNSQAEWIKREDTTWNSLSETIDKFGRDMFETVSEPAYWLTLSAWLWIPVLLAVAFRRRNEAVTTVVKKVLSHPLGSLVVFLVVMYLVMPYHFIGWHKANSRVIPFVLGILLAAVGSITTWVSPRVQRFLMGSVAVILVAVSMLIAPQVVAMDRTVKEFNSGIEHFAPNSKLLPILVENPVFGGIRPVTRAHDYYHIQKGGANRFNLPSLNTLSVMWFRTYPVDINFPPGKLETLADNAENIRKQYDYILVFGGDEASITNQMETIHFEKVHHQGRTKLYRNGTPRPVEADGDVANAGQNLSDESPAPATNY